MAADHVPEMYLGDGVWATFDGFAIWLSTRGQGQNHQISLEPEGVENLEKFIQRVKAARDV